uniref:HPS5-like beta-propeller domain-containing protein n=1 Tax=Echeneis naucrates TaxID=173247 RepID=A0A665UNC5_ECHNA
MAAQPTSPSVLREFCPLYYLLNAIPAKVQRGFRSVLVYLTALDSSNDFLAVGSSIGMLYLYCRRLAHMNKYSLEGKCDAITAVKLLSCFDDLVAVGTASGRVAVFHLVSPLPGRNKQLKRFDVVGLHRGSVTSLAWSTNGMKLFSGDDKGRVIFTALDLDQGVCNPVLLLEESSGVVQVEYSHQVLLVSTQQRSLLYCTQRREVQQLGTRPRKSSGRFGACFLPALCKQSDLQVFAARPGLRLWRTNVRGQVEETHLLRPLFNSQVPQFQLFPRPGPGGGYRPSERQLGLLNCFLRESWVLSWNEYSLYVFDCVHEVTALETSGDIVSVSCCDNEIFVLKGDRDIIRLSNSPEGLASNCESTVNFRLVTFQVMEQLGQRSGLLTSSSRSRSSSVTSWESLHGNTPVTSFPELSTQRYSAPLGQEEMQQELVVKAVRVKKRRRRRGERLKKNNNDTTMQLNIYYYSCINYKMMTTATLQLNSKSTATTQLPRNRHKPDQVRLSAEFKITFSLLFQLAESWMGYSGPGCGILSLQVTDRYVWCLDFKGGLFCSALPETGLNWQRFEDNVHQVALSPSGNLLWKVEQKSMTAFACAKVSAKGKRHWYKAVEQTAFVALSDDSAWIIRTNGDLYLQTGLSVERPCARSVKVDSPCVFSQVCVRGGVVWALSEHQALFYREGLNSYCSEGEGWKYDTVSEAQGLELMCVSLGDGGTAWALDASGSLWFRTGICSSRPQGDDDHWWQISISDYVVFDQGSLFQTLLQATQSVATVTRAPVERVVAFLSQYSQCQPSLVSANASGVWVASGRNQLHLARGSLVGTFWQNVVPRGTVSATRWTFVTSSAVPHREGTFLWLAQSRKDLFCVWDQDGELRPSSVPLPPEVELIHLSACRDALWGLDTHGQVNIRTVSPSCPTGLHWTPLDLSQLGNVRLVSVSCGSQNVWAVDSRGVVYFRVGTQPLNPSMMLPAWIHIEPPAQPIGVQLVSIQTSPNDRLLWALDNRGSVFVRAGLSDEMPVGTDWELVPGLAVAQLVLSCRTVWVRCVNGDLARRFGVSDRNPAGDYWKKIPGAASCLTVTPEDELWAVTVIGGLSRRLTKLLPQTPCKPASSGLALSGEDVDEEWELI